MLVHVLAGIDIDSFPFREMENLQFREPPVTPTAGYSFVGEDN